MNRFFPVCEKCFVKCNRCYRDSNLSRTIWHECPICGNGDPQSSIIECGLTEEDLDCNLRFFTFIKGNELDDEVNSKWD